jgi:hypothetical protein
MAAGASDGPVAERSQAVVRTARVRQATAIKLEERRDMGIPLKVTVPVRGYAQSGTREIPY